MKTKVAIVGGGLTGLSSAAHLLLAAAEQYEIHVFESAAMLGGLLKAKGGGSGGDGDGAGGGGGGGGGGGLDALKLAGAAAKPRYELAERCTRVITLAFLDATQQGRVDCLLPKKK